MSFKTSIKGISNSTIGFLNSSSLLLFCVSLSLIVVFLSVLYVIQSEYKLADNTLTEKIKYTNRHIEDMVIEDLWVIDTIRLQQNISDLVVGDPEINFIKVIDADGESYISNNDQEAFDGEILHQVSLLKNEFEIGQLIISYSIHKNAARKEYVKRLLSLAMFELLLISGLVFLYRRNQKQIYKANVVRYRSIFKNLTDPVLEFSVREQTVNDTTAKQVDLLNINSSAENYFKRLQNKKNTDKKTYFIPSLIIDEIQKFANLQNKNLTQEFNFKHEEVEYTLLMNFYKYRNLDINSDIVILSFSDLTTYRARVRDEKLMLQNQFAHKNMEEIGRLTGEIAHDINNILFSIMGYVDYARLNKGKHSKINYLSGIEKACESAKKIVSQILISSRDKKRGVKVIDVLDACQEALGFVRAGISKGIELKTDFQCRDVYIRLNQTYITQILLNLCTNSAQSMLDNAGEIILSVKKVTITEDQIPAQYHNVKPGEFIEIAISDDGGGIKEEDIKRIYEPYFTTKASGFGVGLGLSLVFGIVSKADGFINVESTVGNGTTFRVWFPVAQKTDENITSYAKEILNQTAQVKTILFLDDNETVTKINTELLEKLGFEVTPFVDSVQALESISLAQDKFDLLVSDVVLPKMSGVELLEKMNVLGIFIPTILISGYNEERNIAALSKYGVQKMISKPFHIEELYDAICSVDIGR